MPKEGAKSFLEQEEALPHGRGLSQPLRVRARSEEPKSWLLSILYPNYSFCYIDDND